METADAPEIMNTWENVFDKTNILISNMFDKTATMIRSEREQWVSNIKDTINSPAKVKACDIAADTGIFFIYYRLKCIVPKFFFFLGKVPQMDTRREEERKKRLHEENITYFLRV
jgi:hypothetical protein